MVAEGEVWGTAITGGASRKMQRGDVAHVAAGIPHQFLLSDEKGLSCLTVRVNEVVEKRI
jgi:quercetin dioxygenase-like cupin family protein